LAAYAGQLLAVGPQGSPIPTTGIQILIRHGGGVLVHYRTGKGKGAVPQWGLGEVLISQTSAVEPVGG